MAGLTVFARILEKYPRGTRLAGAGWVIPAAETVLAGALLAPWAATHIWGCWGMTAFLMAASGAIYGRYRRGEEQFACGCSGNLEEESRAAGMLVRNALLLAATVFATVGWRVAIKPAHYAIGLALLLAFDLMEAARTQEGRIHSWKDSGSRLT